MVIGEWTVSYTHLDVYKRQQILEQLQENLEIAATDMIPICQDTGMAVVFLEIGQEVHLTGGNLEEAVNELSLIHICPSLIKSI